MRLEEALWTYLTTQPYPLSVGNRIYQYKAPQGSSTSPAAYVVISRVSIDPKRTQGGIPSTLERTMQLSTWSKSQSEAATVADAIRGLLDGFAGMMSTIRVYSVFLDNERQSYDDVTQQFHFISDFRFQYLDQ